MEQNTIREWRKKVVEILNCPHYRNYWFPKLAHAVNGREDSSIQLVCQDGTKLFLRIALQRVPRGELYQALVEKIIVVPYIDESEDAESICEAIYNAVIKYNTLLQKQVRHTVREADRKDGVREDVERMKQMVQSPPQFFPGFEQDFFGINSQLIYTTWTTEQIMRLSGPRMFQDNFQKKHYDWDPANPKTQKARQLFVAIQDGLTPNLKPQLRFCCMLGSILDRKAETDLVILLANSAVARVRVDLTGSHVKTGRTNAVMILRSGFYGTVKLQEFASVVAKKLQGL